MKNIVIILFASMLVLSLAGIARSDSEENCRYKIYGKARIKVGYPLVNADAQLIGPLGSQTVQTNANGRYLFRVKAPCKVYRGNYIRVFGINSVDGLQYGGDSKMFRMRGDDSDEVVKQIRHTKVRIIE